MLFFLIPLEERIRYSCYVSVLLTGAKMFGNFSNRYRFFCLEFGLTLEGI